MTTAPRVSTSSRYVPPSIVGDYVELTDKQVQLLAIASDPKTSSEERNRAIFALEGFALNRAEYEVYRQAARIGEGREGHGH